MAKVYQDTRSRKQGGLRPWCISYVGLDGKRHREKTTAATKAEAEAILRKKLSELTKAKLTDAHSVEAIKPRLFEDFIKEEYLPHCKAMHTSTTYRSDQTFFRAVLPIFGKRPLRSITTGDLQRFVDQRAHRILYYTKDEKGKKVPVTAKPATTNRELMFMSGALREALRRGYVEKNSATGIRQLPEHNNKLRWLTPQEEERLLGYAPDFLKPIILTALHTGMRLGEILGLKWADVDFEQKIVRVSQSKNHKVRYIPMNRQLVALLESIPHFTGKHGPSPYVFTNPKTGSRYVDTGHRFGRVSRRSGLRDVTFHTLRHTFASRLAQAGVPLNTIRELLGHGTMVMTMRYAHLAPNNLREAVEILAPNEQEAAKQNGRSKNKGARLRK
jgi:integrase